MAENRLSFALNKVNLYGQMSLVKLFPLDFFSPSIKKEL